jgi:N-acetylneuraminic acid mutarotase
MRMDMSRSVVLLLVLVFLTALCLIAFKPVSAGSPNSWTSRAPMQVARSGLGVAVVNGKIYAIGGASSNGFLATNEVFDPATNTWTSKESMPTPRSDFGIVVFQNKIYCIGGYADGFFATGVTEVYDPATNNWETKAPMPTARMSLQATSINGKIYLIGGIFQGENSGVVSNLNEVYNPVTDKWSDATPIPTAVYSYASAVIDNEIYVITSDLNQIYDAETDSWSTGAPPSLPTVFPSAAATTGGFAPERIYLFGHSVDPKMPFWQLTTTQDFIAQSYDPKTDTWTVCSSVPTVRFDASAAVMNDKAYVIGGFNLEYPT